MTALRFLAGTVASLALFSCASSKSNTPLPPSADVAARGVDGRIVSYVNAKRDSAGKQAMNRDPRLDALALEQARRIASEGRLNHSGFQDRFEQAHAKTGAQLFAENLHCVAPGNDPARELVEAWLASSIHRNNILNSAWNRTGVATTADSTGRIWAAQVFAVVP